MSDRFGNYDFLEKIAVGGMAEIFKATVTHEKGVEKLVCIKRIHPALSADKDFVAMFIDEARLGVSLVHGNIVPVFDFGYVDGHYFLAMEYVDGKDLAALRGRAKVVGMDWPLDLSIFVMMEILEGLSYVHKKLDSHGLSMELIHRDVSPSNVLLSNDGQVKLLDFGIARSHSREFETRTGVIKGKLGYMSPEQALGDTVDARTDVWSCGAILHELCTGTKLKDGRKKLDDPLLEKVLSIALSPNPDDRYSNALEMQGALGDVLAERNWRPYARDLSAFIDRINTTDAPGEDWDMKSNSVEQHVADAMKLSRDNLSNGTPPKIDNAKLENPITVKLLPSKVPEKIDPSNTSATKTSTLIKLKTKLRILTVILILTSVAISLTYTLTPRSTDHEPPIQDTLLKLRQSKTPTKTNSSDNLILEATDKLPENTQVIPSNQKRGPAPIEVNPMKPGIHQVSASLPGYTTQKKEVIVKAKKNTFVKIKRKKALVHINTVPWSVVLLDGKQIGQTPIRGFTVSSGRHAVVLTNPVSNISKTVIFTIKPGEEKKISEKLIN